MRSPDLVDPDRLEELLEGAPPEREREAELQRLVRELRMPAPAPAAVRQRVRALDTKPKPRLALKWRPAAVALVAGAVLCAGVGSALLLRDTRSEAPREAAVSAPVEETAPAIRWPPLGGDDSDGGGDAAFSEPATVPSAEPLSAGPLPDTSRARDVDMSLELRVRDGDAVSDAANEAMRTTRELGGYVVSSSVGTRGEEGRARLALRVPVGRLEDALLRLSALGTITEQQVEIEDLQGSIDRRARRMEALRRAIEIDELRLRSGTLTPEERLAVEIRLERRRDLLADVARARARLLRQAATAELSVTLHTREAAAGPPDESRIGGAARDALDFLGGAGSVAVFTAIVTAPLTILALLAWLVARSRSRRLDREVLEQPRPAAAPPH